MLNLVRVVASIRCFRLTSPMEVRRFSIMKQDYDSTEVFIEKAKEHLATGDAAQCCEKLFGSVKFALREYVTRLGKAHAMPAVKPEDWTYAKYRKLSTVITKFERDKEEFNISDGWSAVENLHVHGWNLNEIEPEQAELGIETTEKLLQKISKLPVTEEIAAKVYAELFGLNLICESFMKQDVLYHSRTNPIRERPVKCFNTPGLDEQRGCVK